MAQSVGEKNPFALDEDGVNMYEELGHEKFVALSTAFYTRVYSSTDEEFRKMFASNNDMFSAVQNQYEFFIQRFGGPPLFSTRKGHPALRGRHVKFPITKKYADLWLHYMSEALSDIGITERQKKNNL